jgi:hypothetical protein
MLQVMRDGMFRMQTTVGTVGVGWWLDYGARLTLSVDLQIHDSQPKVLRK